LNRTNYNKVLMRLLQQNGRLRPSKLDLEWLAPHLQYPDHLSQCLEKGLAVSLPSLWVRGAFWHLQPTVQRYLQIKACRTADSYQGDGAHKRQPNPETPLFLPDALNFANHSWPESLEDDTSISAARFTFCDPASLGRSLLSTYCSATFSTDILQFPKDDPLRLSSLLDDSLVRVAAQPIMREEWLGDGTAQFYYCMRCGRTLLPTHCSGCNVRYARPQKFPDTVMPLPWRIKRALKGAGIRLMPVGQWLD
jgi:hypothetical protein